MWFRNLTLFRLLQPFSLSAEQLDEKLALKPFRAGGSLEMETTGWVPPLGREGAPLVHVVGEHMVVCARTQKKLLPASVIREVVDERATEIEDEEGRKVGRKERKDLRDDVIQELLPKAFTSSRNTYAGIDPKGNWLLVDSAARNRAEDLTVLMRECLGSLSIAPPKPTRPPVAVMTGWLRGEDLPDGFAIEDECELREPVEKGGVVRCVRQDLFSDEIQAHLEAGKEVVKLALNWRDRLHFVLGDDLQVRRLRFQDVVTEVAADASGDSKEQEFDADFAIMSQELARFLLDLMEAFGGED